MYPNDTRAVALAPLRWPSSERLLARRTRQTSPEANEQIAHDYENRFVPFHIGSLRLACSWLPSSRKSLI